MRDILLQIERANDGGLYYMALFTSLCVPDICGALESADGLASGRKYAAWFDQWVAPRYGFQGRTSLDGAACYAYRNAALHQGRAQHRNLGYSRIIFAEPGAPFTMHNNVLNDALNIDVQIFCGDIITGCRAWLAGAEATPIYQNNWGQSMQRYPMGLAPYMVGFPVIG